MNIKQADDEDIKKYGKKLTSAKKVLEERMGEIQLTKYLPTMKRYDASKETESSSNALSKLSTTPTKSPNIFDCDRVIIVSLAIIISEFFLVGFVFDVITT